MAIRVAAFSAATGITLSSGLCIGGISRFATTPIRVAASTPPISRGGAGTRPFATGRLARRGSPVTTIFGAPPVPRRTR